MRVQDQEPAAADEPRPVRGRLAGPKVRRKRISRRRRRRLRRTVFLVILVLLLPVGWSYEHALTAPGSSSLAVRTVEWVSAHGGQRLVLWAERTWYSRHAPPVGGTPQGGIPTTGSRTPSGSGTQQQGISHLPAPPAIRPIADHPLPQEGTWQPVGQQVGGVPTMYESFLRPDRLHTSLLAGVVWMDTSLLNAELIPGTQVPPNGSWNPSGEVPRSQRNRLAAAFNSGFLLNDSRGGWYSQGRTGQPLRNGAASLVINKDGSATVGAWGRDVSMSPQVASVRQNLSLIVNGGRPVAGLGTNNFQIWGATLGNAVLVWRSGVGVTQDGALVYAAGPGLSVQTLADILARAGAVRAMELDINTEWVTFNFYAPRSGHPYGEHTSKLLAAMTRPSTRYLVPDERDFVAMLVPSTPH
ncbi:MAG: phosphodiester glycosidase family protein [Actinomycetota bacterium]|nr:phosphodiester glycosidase family protein [Actinomycetota bacterium]